MNTVLTAEQKARKNELARARRAMKKQEKENISQLDYKTDSSNENDEKNEIVVEEEPLPTQEIAVEVEEEDPEVVRKREIAEKRRASLALARSKIKPKSQITKEKDEEIQRIKEENQRLKEAVSSKVPANPPKPKVIKKYIREQPKKTYQQSPQQQVKEPSLEYLTQETYAEQLQKRLRENMLQKVMMDTFM